MKFFSKKAADNSDSVEGVPAYAFCEPVTASPTSPHHIRAVGPEGLKLGGGVPNPALCGRDLHRGWDIGPTVTADMVKTLAEPRAGDGRVFLCNACAQAYLAHL